MAQASDVAIIGAGVTGLSIAFHLAECERLSVTLYERTGIGAEASGVQPGGVRQQWSTSANCLMARDSMLFYADLGFRLDCATPPTLERCGYIFVAHSLERLEQLERDVTLQNSLGVPSRMLSPVEAAEFLPGVEVDSITGASFCEEDAYFDRPQAVVEAFAEASQARGATLQVAEVVGLTQDGGGWTLDLAGGGTAQAEHVVVATGYDAPELVRSLGLELPVRKDPRYLFYSDPVRERLLEPLVVSAERHFAAKQLSNGRVLASHLAAREDPAANESAWRRQVRARIEELVPLLTYVPLPLLVQGFYDLTPDGHAILGPVDGLPNLLLAVGFSGHGFMMAPSVGRCLAAAVLDGSIDPLIEPFSLGRFAAGGLEPELQVV